MHTFRSFLQHLTLFFCCLLIFLLLFEERFVAPVFLQVVGRGHPLLLHFPIALLLVYAGYSLIKKDIPVQKEHHFQAQDLLLLAAFTASLSALMGLVLSKEGGYFEESLLWHKWSGSLLAILSYAWYSNRIVLESSIWKIRIVSIVCILLVIWAGHLGAGITHGENFVLAPLKPDASTLKVPFEEALAYTHLVQPILEEKCMACHNSRKAKGELVMESPESLIAGGKNGPLWDSPQPGESLLLRRIFLAESADEHMPPAGKPQLTALEIEILESWIESGADFKMKAANYPQDHPVYRIAAEAFSDQNTNFDFEAASSEVVESLNGFYRLVSPIAVNSPALAVRFLSSEAYSSEKLKELDPIKMQIVELSLAKMPVSDQDLAIISTYENLQKLNLNFSKVTDQGMEQLVSLKKLREVALSGTAVGEAGLAQLKKIDALSKVFVWNSAISLASADIDRDSVSGIRLVRGYSDENVVINLPVPIVEKAAPIFSGRQRINIRHYINGAELRYTLDGSEPDSISSPIYKESFQLESNALLKVKAYKSGWYGSETVSRMYLNSKLLPDSIEVISTPGEKYRARMGQTLIDREKGTTNHGDGSWLGHEGVPLEVLMRLGDERPDSLTISYLASTGSYIFPPASVEIWFGRDNQSLQLYKKANYDMPGKHLPITANFITVDLPDQEFDLLKVVVHPFKKLPAWHDGKGKPAWVFVDELLLN